MSTIRRFPRIIPAAYFDATDFALFAEPAASDPDQNEGRLRIKEKLLTLHNEIFPRIRELRWDIYPSHKVRSLISPAKIGGTVQRIGKMYLNYNKPETLLKLMNKRFGGDPAGLASAHLSIGLDEQGLMVELQIPADAWVDGVNFKNKAVGGPPGKQQLRQLLANFGDLAITLEESAGVSPGPIYRARAVRWVNLGVLEAALAKYEPTRQTLRVGCRLAADDHRLEVPVLPGFVLDRLAQVYPLYDYLAWSPKNNYVRAQKFARDPARVAHEGSPESEA